MKNKSFHRVITILLIILIINIGHPSTATQVCECQTTQKACGAMCFVAVVVAIMGGIFIWGIRKMCKKLLPPPSDPPPPPPPPDNNTNKTAQVSGFALAQQAASGPQCNVELCDPDGSGVAVWTIAAYGWTNPKTGDPYVRMSNVTIQSCTNLIGNLSAWKDEVSSVSYTSMGARTNTLTIIYAGRCGFDANGVWHTGPPLLTNYCDVNIPGSMSPNYQSGGGPQKFFRLSAVQ